MIPGTQLPLSSETAAAFSAMDPLLSAAGGLSLSQVTGITGLRASTIQNWVKRGFVPNPREKRYDETALARILIINILRDCIQLEKIHKLMQYVNGSVEDRTDDIITDRELYNMLCAAIIHIGEQPLQNPRALDDELDNILGDYRGPRPDSRQRVKKALTVMLLAHSAATLKRQVDGLLADLSPDSQTDRKEND